MRSGVKARWIARWVRCVCFFACALSAAACDQDATNARVPPTGEDIVDDFRPRPDATSGDTHTNLTTNPDTNTAEDTAAFDIQTTTDTQTATDTHTTAQDTHTPQDVASASERLVQYLEISRIDIYQTVRVPWMENQQPATTTTPIIAGRETLVRVFVSPRPGWTPQTVTAALLVQTAGGEQLLTHTRDVFGASSDADALSTFGFRVPPDLITTTTRLSVRLTVENGGDIAADNTQHPAAWPTIGQTAALNARADGGPLKVMLVPLRYDGDGSGRLPDTSATQLGYFDGVLRALYPSTDVQIQIHSVISWDQWLDFGDINQFLVQLKEDERAAEDIYYYALIKPDETFDDYCTGTCTTGQSFTVSDGGEGIYRVGSGVGFSGEDWAWTLAHELGHMHGRGHAPCDVSWWSDDDGYPYNGGIVGVWGWDRRDGQLKPPEDWTDMMGYCDVQWMSDYTYEGIFERTADVKWAADQLTPWRSERRFRFLTLNEVGAAKWGRDMRLRAGHTGRWVTLRVLAADGQALHEVQAPQIATGHAGAADVLVPVDVLSIEGARLVEVDGVRVEITER